MIVVEIYILVFCLVVTRNGETLSAFTLAEWFESGGKGATVATLSPTLSWKAVEHFEDSDSKHMIFQWWCNIPDDLLRG